MSLSLPIHEAPATPVGPAGAQRLVTATRPFHVMSKPIGPICNLDCRYCFYLEKEHLYPAERRWAMPDEVLEQFIRQYIQSQPGPHVSFTWQGGEPTLLGVRFFRRVMELQRKYADGRQVDTALQTNGTLLDEEWADFLAEHRILVGISIDGPPDLHDAYRVDKQGRPTAHKVLSAIELLKRHGVDFNTLTVVNHINSRRPLEVYRFLREIGSGFLQFIPLVERHAPGEAATKREGLWLAGPPGTGQDEALVTDWSVRPRDYGAFLSTIFDEWVRRDVGQVFVQAFDVALANWMRMLTGYESPRLCFFSDTCGNALAIEHNGDVYSCDHYVYPEFRLGNILKRPLGELVNLPFQRKFGLDKSDTLPAYCRACEVRFACHGECPKHRFIRTPAGEPGLNYLCQGYRAFFNHIDPAMRAMAGLLAKNQPPALVRELVLEQERHGGPLGRRFSRNA